MSVATAVGGLGRGHALQIFRAAADTYYCILCYCKLGRVAILQEFLISGYTVRGSLDWS